MALTETKPRKEIAAMYSSPGPVYKLPGLVGQREHDPRSVHNKGPAWPFGLKHGKWRDDSGPGPCYLPGSKMFKDGKDGTPQYSLYSRPKDGTLYATPGPGAYAPERGTGKMVYESAPAYTFGDKHAGRRTDDVPGPNVYAVDPMLGKTVRSNKASAPNPSMTGRSKIGGFHEDLQKTPGPGNYTVTNPGIYKQKSPQYSMTSRNVMPSDTTTKPGPGAHYPERCNFKQNCPGGITFGIRHSQYKGEMITEADVDY